MYRVYFFIFRKEIMKKIYLFISILTILSGCMHPYGIEEKVSYLQAKTDGLEDKSDLLQQSLSIQVQILTEQIQILHIKSENLKQENELIKKHLRMKIAAN